MRLEEKSADAVLQGRSPGHKQKAVEDARTPGCQLSGTPSTLGENPTATALQCLA